MDYIQRELEPKLKQFADKFPIVAVTGPRQSGKSTLARHAFPDYEYVSLETPFQREFAQEDPLGFLSTYPDRTIIDEAQRVPELFSYLQEHVDTTDQPGQYILSGSQNFLLSERISQSLAGRVSTVHLLPFSRYELAKYELLPDRLDKWLHTGGYPRIYKYDIEPEDYFPSYIETYLERDVRGQLANGSLIDFQRFLRLCAGRTGQILDMKGLAQESGIDTRTAKRWLSVLQASFIVYLIQPYFRNFNKRLVKRPKLYFCDTGLLCSLLGIHSINDVALSPFRGAVFENMAYIEYIKRSYGIGRIPEVWFWHETNTNEVDLIYQKDSQLKIAELKSGATYSSKWFSSMKVFTRLADVPPSDRSIIYGGNENLRTSLGDVISWRDW